MNIFEELASLPCHELDASADDRIRRGAHARLEQGRRRRESSMAHTLRVVWSREIEPAFVVASGISILAWALSAVMALY